MNIRLIATTVFAALLCVGAHASEPKIKKLEAAKVESLRFALQADVSKASVRLSAWFDTISVCAPQLWQSVGASLDKSGIEVIPVHFGTVDGACFKGSLGNQRFAAAIAPWLSGGIVRLPTPEEIQRYWFIFPFDEIEEPVFIISSEKADILVHLQLDKDKQRYFVFMIEAFRLGEKKPEPNQRPEGTPGKSPSSNPSQVPGAPHP